MEKVSSQLDEILAHLAWSLWTELGVAGLTRHHQEFSIAPEELIMLTAVLSEFDPRLRDEALDWCSQYHRFISPIRLQILSKKYGKYVAKSFSTFSATYNAATDLRTKWIIPEKSTPLKFRQSGKSTLRSFDSPSMIHFRLRSLFGLGARSDILAFLLSDRRGDFTVSDLTETGYSKRHLAEILGDLSAAGILFESQIRNQFRYAFTKRILFTKLIGGIPKNMLNWQKILAVLLPIRACLQNVEDAPLGVRAVDMRNLFMELISPLSELKWMPPPMQKDLEAYWISVTKWILDQARVLSKRENCRRKSP